MYVLQVIVCHMLSIDMSWSATSNEAENTTFFEEMPKILAEVQAHVCILLYDDCGDVVLSRVRPVGRIV